MKKILKNSVVLLSFLAIWQMVVFLFHLPVYLLPGPVSVFLAFIKDFPLIAHHALPTLIEIVLGFILGSLFGIMSALLMIYFRPVKIWFLPLLLISQAIPTFAIAPILVVWFGYGMAGKMITAMIMIFFPVTSAFYDGLRRVDAIWLDLAKTMNGKPRKILRLIKIPAALPNLASGLRVAAAIAPIGAIAAEWVGSSQGLGFLMLDANARLQIPLMFATVFALMCITFFLYFTVDRLLKRIIFW